MFLLSGVITAAAHQDFTVRWEMRGEVMVGKCHPQWSNGQNRESLLSDEEFPLFFRGLKCSSIGDVAANVRLVRTTSLTGIVKKETLSQIHNPMSELGKLKKN